MRTPRVQFFQGHRSPYGGRFDRQLWYWRLRAANGHVIAVSSEVRARPLRGEGYASRRNARRAWQTVRAIARNFLRTA